MTEHETWTAPPGFQISDGSGGSQKPLVVTGMPTVGDTLVWNGTDWVPSSTSPVELETPVGEDSIPLKLTGQPDQEEPLFRVVDSASDDDKLFEVFGYKSGSFLVARDFYRHEFLEVLATGDGHVGEITLNSGTSDTVLRSRAADTQLSLSHDRIVLGNGGATDRLWLAAGKVIFTQATVAPDDAALSAGHMALWLDQTNGAAKLMVKAKQADGTVVTGSVNLSV